MDFEKIVNYRHSVRSFLNKEIEPEKIEKILEIVNLCPSAGNLQAFKIFLVKKLEIKKLLTQAALNQDFIQEAPMVMVFCANQEESAKRYEKRGRELYAIQDATIAASYAQLAAADLGIGTVWVGAFDPEEVKSILKISDLLPIAIIPLGYSSETSFSRERKELKDLVAEE